MKVITIIKNARKSKIIQYPAIEKLVSQGYELVDKIITPMDSDRIAATFTLKATAKVMAGETAVKEAKADKKQAAVAKAKAVKEAKAAGKPKVAEKVAEVKLEKAEKTAIVATKVAKANEPKVEVKPVKDTKKK